MSCLNNEMILEGILDDVVNEFPDASDEFIDAEVQKRWEALPDGPC